MKYFTTDSKTAYEAKAEAQRIAYAPVMFQACRVLRDSGILELVQRSGANGMALSEVVPKTTLSRYAVKVLMEAGLGIGVFCLNEERFTMTKLGYFLLRDPMTRINMDVVHHVFYRGMFDLDKSLEQGKPAGLKTLGDWKTLYDGLSQFRPEERESWLAWDHYYSDAAFPAALPLVLADHPKRLLDIGGNTGKWAIQCAKFDPNVRVTIADLPQQIELARPAIQQSGVTDRIDFFAIDILDESQLLPDGCDVIWMSQFLDCFSEKEIVSILRRATRAMSSESTLCILELFWDRQPNETAAFCLQQTSLYFTCLANGNSQMYHSSDLMRCLSESGLAVIEDRDQVGLYHTLLKCRKV